MNRPRARTRVLTTSHTAQSQFNLASDLEELVALPKPQNSLAAGHSTLGEYLAKRPGRTRKSSSGLKTLKEITARLLAHNLDAITTHVLGQFEWTHIKQIWAMVEEEMLDTIDAFAKFATAFPREFPARKSLHVSISDLAAALTKVIALALRCADGTEPHAAAPPWSFHLDLSHIPIPQDILLQMGSVPGLTVLKVNDSNVTDKTINHWSRSESATGFSRLQQLDLRSNLLKEPDVAIQKLLQFRSLSQIRCDVTPQWKNVLSEDQQTLLQGDWLDRQKAALPVLELKAHLGSRADRRPLTPQKDEIIIDVATARNSLDLGKKTVTTVCRTTDQLHNIEARKKKRMKHLSSMGDAWK